MGFSQPLIGTFSIPVGKLKSKTENKRVEDLAVCDEIIAFLTAQMQKSADDLNQDVSARKSASSIAGEDRFSHVKLEEKKSSPMKAAVSKLGAVNAIKNKKAEVEMEDRKDGYNQLIEEQVDSIPGDEENQLIKDTIDDDTLFAGL